jgi:hypothetical protein
LGKICVKVGKEPLARFALVQDDVVMMLGLVRSLPYIRSHGLRGLGAQLPCWLWAVWCLGVVCLLISGITPAFAQRAGDQFSFGPVPVRGREPYGRSLGVQVGALSDAVFRGRTLYDRAFASGMVQSRYSFGKLGTVQGAVWGGAPLEGDSSDDSFFSVAPALSYEFTYSRFTFAAGHSWYLYPHRLAAVNSTAEVWGGVTLDTVLNPSFTVYQDYDAYKSSYFEIGLRHTFLRSGTGGYNFTVFSNVGFAAQSEQQYAHGGLVQITSGVSTDLRIGSFTLRPMVAYTGSEDGAVSNRMWGGLQVVYQER